MAITARRVDRSLREEALGVYSTTGVYEITLDVPESGVYLLFVESLSNRVQYRQLPYLTLHANAAQ